MYTSMLMFVLMFCIFITFHTLDILRSPKHYLIGEKLNDNNKGKSMHAWPR